MIFLAPAEEKAILLCLAQVLARLRAGGGIREPVDVVPIVKGARLEARALRPSSSRQDHL